MQKRSPFTVVLVSFMTLWVAYIFIQIIDLAIIYSIILFLYEFIIGNAIIFFNFSFSLLKYSISYLFIFFVLCLFMNIRYKSVIKWKFFGLDLQKYNSKVTTLVFFFKEYNYAGLIILNLLVILVLLYYIMHKNFLIIGFILGFYIFIGLSIYIKRLLIKKNYFNKASFNIFINMLLASITVLYVSEVGDSIEQYVGLKINWSEFIYGFLNKKDKFFYKVKNDDFIYKWWNIQELYKKQKLSENYIYFKNQIINKNFFNDISNENKKNAYIKSLKPQIKMQQKNINFLNLQNNNIYTDKNIVYYNQEKYTDQTNLLKNLNYSKFLEHKKWRLYLLNMKNITAGDLAPRGTRNKLSNIELLLNKDKKSIIQNLDKALLDENIAKKLNYYVQYKHNQYKFFNMLLDKNISDTTKNFLFLKFTHISVSNLIKQYINIKINIFVKYNEFFYWWENKNYIVSNFFKGYNLKKYISLTKYHFKGKQALYNLFNKDETNNVLKPIKIGKIQDVTFKLKLTNYQDRNALLHEYFKSSFNKKIKLINSRNISHKIINNDYINMRDNSFFFKKIQIEPYQSSYFKECFHDLVELTNNSILKTMYFKYYPPLKPIYYEFKNDYNDNVLYSEQYNNSHLSTFNNNIKYLSETEYQKICKSNWIYNSFFYKYSDYYYNNKINKLETDINNTKTLFSLFFKGKNYNNKSWFLDFKSFYTLKLNKLNIPDYSVYYDYSVYKKYIIQIANNLDIENNTKNFYYQQFLLKTADILALYCSSNKISYGELLYKLQQWKIYLTQYMIDTKFKMYNYTKEFDFEYIDTEPEIELLDIDSDMDIESYFQIKFDDNIDLDNIDIDDIEIDDIQADIDIELDNFNFMFFNDSINIYNLALDTKLAMLYEDLDAKILELESNYRYERELMVSNNLLDCIAEWEDILDNEYTQYIDEMQESWPNYLRMYKTDIYNPELKFFYDADYVLKYASYLDYSKLDPKDIIMVEGVKEKLKILGCQTKADLKPFFDSFQEHHNECLKYLSDSKTLDFINLMKWYNDGLEDIVYNTVSIYEEEQMQLELDIEYHFKSLREFNLKRKEFIKEQAEQEQQKKDLVKNNIITKNWDDYNQIRFRNEIMNFKIKK